MKKVNLAVMYASKEIAITPDKKNKFESLNGIWTRDLHAAGVTL